MKREIMMMGLAMMTGFPQAACARNGKENAAQGYSSWNTPYIPHYGVSGAAHPLMDHASVSGALPGQSLSNTWQLELAPPSAVASADDPLSASVKRVGFSLKLDF